MENINDFLIENTKAIYAIQQMNSVLGDDRKILTNFLYSDGINKKKRLPPTDRSLFTQVFWTRPQLRLTRDNLYRSNKLARLLNKDPLSIERYVLLTLDRRLGLKAPEKFALGSGQGAYKKLNEVLTSPLVNNESPFISVFNNALETLTGWPDILFEFFTSKEGLRGEQYLYPDGINEYNRAFDLNARFLNVIEEPVSLILDTWLEYMYQVKKGNIIPYWDLQISREVDSQTGIFVFVLASDNRSIKHVAKTIGTPASNPVGKIFDYDRNGNKATEMQDIDVLIKCSATRYDEPWLLYDFNKTVASWNPDLYKYLTGGDLSGSGYIELPPELYDAFNNEAIPFIDLRYNKLEWLVKEEKIKKIQKQIEQGVV
jgi:hypothetical protein